MGSASHIRLGSTPASQPEVTSGHRAPEAAGRMCERQGDGGHTLEDSRTSNGQWMQDEVEDG